MNCSSVTGRARRITSRAPPGEHHTGVHSKARRLLSDRRYRSASFRLPRAPDAERAILNASGPMQITARVVPVVNVGKSCISRGIIGAYASIATARRLITGWTAGSFRCLGQTMRCSSIFFCLLFLNLGAMAAAEAEPIVFIVSYHNLDYAKAACEHVTAPLHP